jgi:hypothetical protein
MMTNIEAIEYLGNLRLLRQVYLKLFKNENNDLYSHGDLKFLIKETNLEIERVVDLMYNMELLDSYDQNTGEVNKIYRNLTEEENLKKVCGGPKYEGK